MPSTEELRQRHAPHRMAIRELEERVDSQKNFCFDSEDLQHLGIRKIQTSFEDGSKLNPVFFAPYSKDKISPPLAEFMESEYPTYNAEDTYLRHAVEVLDFYHDYADYCQTHDPEPRLVGHYSGWCHQDVGAYKFRGLYEDGKLQKEKLGPQDHREWIVEDIKYHSEITKFPHLRSMMALDIEGKNEVLYRGELLAIIRIIRGRLHTSLLLEHTFHPVLMFSGMGIQHARIIQAHFNGQELILQHSKLYDLRERDDKLLMLFGRWWSGPPTGKTKSE